MLSPPKLLMMMSSAAGVKGQSDPLTGPRSKFFFFFVVKKKKKNFKKKIIKLYAKGKLEQKKKNKPNKIEKKKEMFDLKWRN